MDTCVFVGYCFKDDRWLKESGIEISSPTKKFTSERVCNEFTRKFRIIATETTETLLDYISSVEKSIGPNASWSKLILDKLLAIIPTCRLQNWLEETVGSLYEKVASRAELILSLKVMLDEYRMFAFSRYEWVVEALRDVVIECWPRYCRYPDIESALVFSGMSNDNDIQIVLDAHDLCCNLGDYVHFVTGDRLDVKCFESDITRLTRIRSVIYLKDITPGMT